MVTLLVGGSLLGCLSALAVDRPAQPPAPAGAQAAVGQPIGNRAQALTHSDTEGLSPERLNERNKLLAVGESALAKLQGDAALQAFERAALIAHSADTEIALVRTYLQSGTYRRALAFSAHTAGAHLDVVDGLALYAWLLHIGGQPGIAKRLLLEAEARTPGNQLLKSVQRQLQSGSPRATPDLLTLPHRMAPYSSKRTLPSSARVAGSGLLLQDGRHALVPLSLVPSSGKLWLRNGLGHLVEARLEQRLPVGVALLRLNQAMPAIGNMLVSGAKAFPGSVGFTVEYVATSDAAPAWPVLSSGFLGGESNRAGERKLGIDMPAGPRGGPVFDVGGRLIGLALPAIAGTPDRMVSVAELAQALGTVSGNREAVRLGTSVSTGAIPAAAVDLIYEASLTFTLQVITAL